MQYTKSKWIKSEESVLEANNESRPDLTKYSISLKPRIEVVLKQIDFQVSKFDEILNSLKSKDDELFRSIISSIKENNTQCYDKLLSDLLQSRKECKIVSLSKIVFEKLETKLKTASDFGDLVIILSPIISVVKNLRALLILYTPESEQELGLISELLGVILVDAAQVAGYTVNFKTANEEAVRLIDNAYLIVRQKIKEEFSDLSDLSVLHSQKHLV